MVRLLEILIPLTSGNSLAESHRCEQVLFLRSGELFITLIASDQK